MSIIAQETSNSSKSADTESDEEAISLKISQEANSAEDEKAHPPRQSIQAIAQVDHVSGCYQKEYAQRKTEQAKI
jgi:hypothetical protein